MGRLVGIALLAVVGLLVPAQAGDAAIPAPVPLAAPPPPDTNIYVQPPTTTGRVMYDGHTGSYTKYGGAISYGVYDSRYFSAHGYASFDLAGVPDSVTVLSVRLWYYQYEHGSLFGGMPQTQLVLIPDVNAPAQQLFADISSGLLVDPQQTTADGWVVRSFNADGLAAVESCRTNCEILNLGVAGGGCAYGAAYGVGPFDPLRAYLEIRYSTSAEYCDIAAIDAALEVFPVGAEDSIPVMAHFTNTGNTTARNLLICASRNGSIGDSARLDSIAPGETARVRMVLPPTGQPTNVKLNIWASAPTDWCTHNDTAVTSTYVYPHGTRSVEGFEPDRTPTFPPEGWLVYNGGDTNTWYRTGPGDRGAHSGGCYARCERLDVNEDWLITYGLSPSLGAADTVGVFFSTPYSWCFPQAWALGSQDPDDIIGLLLDTVIQTQGWCEKHISLDQFDGQTVYVGFRHCATAGGPLCLDDVWFTSERASAVEEPSAACARYLKFGLSHNPIRGSQLVLNYQISRPERLRVTVSDVLGRSVSKSLLPSAPAIGRVRLAVDDWESGVYLIQVSTPTESATVKCVIARGR